MWGRGLGRWGQKFMTQKSITQNQRVSTAKIERSRELRTDMTPSEKVFWEMVRNKRMFGLKFRRQQIIDGFIVDFYCDSIGLCVEIDGGIHDSDDQRNYDKLRDEAIALRGLRILRIRNEDLVDGKDEVVRLIEGMME